ncbi:UDP-2,4-diacetamido-2,4,6-trideoxy-beta-L-altropyranose hydrolase [Methylophilus sp. UBA6697]|uniref:UDP-2,4-diacetamido-2,4, 6-trideoxy-beta-L-altropyranose hydrolase n=1 Tax=Methylophilus sp. UBA6697 TaxID=1946902 RepID=UPI0025F86EEE|nr:UDP-2,4-diacetamido-2,4,6-trideoxy-beta-L-altropyranose hydrolase [Methylophilus sp. UBA6697]
MHVVFRTDASETIGSGHLMRCLLLADAIVQSGGKCSFIIRNRNIVTDRLLKNCSHDVFFLNLLEVVNQVEDALQSIKCMKNILPSVDWVVVDHYGIDAKWEALIRVRTKHILVIDDLANRFHECDVLVDPGYGRKSLDYNCLLSPQTLQLLGPKYAILHPSFALSHASAPLWPELRRVHIFFGGGTSAKWLGSCIESIMEVEHDIEILALGFCDEQVMANLQKKIGGKLEWSRYEMEMVKHYARCSLAVGSPGTATWERACMGIPSAVVATAENQIPILKKLDQLGLCRYLGPASELQTTELRENLRAFFQDDISRSHMRATGLAAVDGKGTERILRNLLEKSQSDA